jgi:Zn-dependent M28 family amino/carboxypeptidase
VRTTAPPVSGDTPTPAISATPLATPTPTSQPSACGTPTCGASPSPVADGLKIDEAAVNRHLDALIEIAEANGGIRAAGTSGYDASVEYVADQLSALGFVVTRQPFEFTFFDEEAPVELTVGDQTWTGDEWLHSTLYGGEGDAAGGLEVVGGQGGFGTACTDAEWSGFTAGHIAIVLGGGCFFRDKVALAQEAGAIAVIAPNTEREANVEVRPTLIDPDLATIPVIVAGREPALALLAAADAGGSAQVIVDTVERPATVENVIAEWPGATDEVVMLGGHLDSVLDGPGINDNGSGVATLLALAESVAANAQPQKTVRFGFWASEENGEFGSTFYVDELPQAERDLINVYLNLDMVGSVDGQRLVYDDALAAPGSSEITDAIVDALRAAGAPGFATDLGGASDHAQFERVGIVTGGVFSDLDACYHQSCDDRDNIDMTMLLNLGGAIATVVEDLAY